MHEGVAMLQLGLEKYAHAGVIQASHRPRLLLVPPNLQMHLQRPGIPAGCHGSTGLLAKSCKGQAEKSPARTMDTAFYMRKAASAVDYMVFVCFNCGLGRMPSWAQVGA